MKRIRSREKRDTVMMKRTVFIQIRWSDQESLEPSSLILQMLFQDLTALSHTHMQVNTYTYGSLWHFCLLNAVGLCGQRSHDHRNSAPHTIPSSCTPVFIPMATAKLGHPGYDSRCLGNVCVCERERMMSHYCESVDWKHPGLVFSISPLLAQKLVPILKWVMLRL